MSYVRVVCVNSPSVILPPLSGGVGGVALAVRCLQLEERKEKVLIKWEFIYAAFTQKKHKEHTKLL